MKAVEQFIYTSSPWGKGGSGWMVFQRSAGVEDALVERLYPYFRYRIPEGIQADVSDEKSLALFPVQFVSFRFGDLWMLAQTCYRGIRWWESRSGDFWAHVFVFSSDIWKEHGDSLNSMRFFQSSLFLREWPKGLRDEFRRIADGKVAYYDPPMLEAYENSDAIRVDEKAGACNDEYAFPNLCARLSSDALGRLGSMLSRMHSRVVGNADSTALVFDAQQQESLAVMGVLLEMLPKKMRREIQFATYIHPETAKEISADGTFLFYGTALAGKAADRDTGLYGEPPQGGPKFESRGDVELFKKMVDACGLALGAEEFDSFVKCWEVATGRARSVEALRAANAFCVGQDAGTPRFGELRTFLLETIAAGLAKDVSPKDAKWRERFAIARFEFGAELGASALVPFCEECIAEKSAFDGVCQCLVGVASAACSFLEALENFAPDKDSKAKLVQHLLKSQAAMPAGAAMDKSKIPLAKMALRYREIVERGADESDSPDDDLMVVEKLNAEVGNISYGSVDMGDVLSMLKYKSAIGKVRSISDINTNLKPPFPKGANVKVDLLSKLNPARPSDKVKLGHALDALALPNLFGDDYVVSEWDKDVCLRRKYVEELEQEKSRNDELKRRPGMGVAICAAIVGALIGWVGHGLWAIVYARDARGTRGGKACAEETHLRLPSRGEAIQGDSLSYVSNGGGGEGGDVVSTDDMKRRWASRLGAKQTEAADGLPESKGSEE